MTASRFALNLDCFGENDQNAQACFLGSKCPDIATVSLLKNESVDPLLNQVYFENLDRCDPLAPFRKEFSLPSDKVYFDGNSLGAMPKVAMEIAHRTLVGEWAGDLVNSWNDAGWFHLPLRLGKKLAPLIGAGEDEVVVTDSTGINLYKVMSAALMLQADRSVILMEGSSFPTDNYIVQGLLKSLGKRHSIRFAEQGDLLASIDSDVAIVCLSDVHYKTGYWQDMRAITARANACGALTVWDVCHSAGVLPIDLNGCDADFAVGCTYKYLSGGPGSPGFVFVACRHHGKALQPLTGWWSHADPFAFERDYRPATGIGQMLSGTQPIVSMALIEPGLDITRRATIAAIREKSRQMSDLFMQLIDAKCADYGFQWVSPLSSERRGSHVALRHAYGYPIIRALVDCGVIGDFRSPDILRFGFAPLYLRYIDVWNAVQRLVQVMQSESWRDPKYGRVKPVT